MESRGTCFGPSPRSSRGYTIHYWSKHNWPHSNPVSGSSTDMLRCSKAPALPDGARRTEALGLALPWPSATTLSSGACWSPPQTSSSSPH
eukprot:10112526-Lingulodinium_polyedra.AAC.1